MHSSFSLLLLVIPLSPLIAQRTLLTEGAETLGRSQFRLGLGIEYFWKERAPFDHVPKSLGRLGVMAVEQGVAENVNLDLYWRGRLVATLPNGTHAVDWGDLSISTKVNLFGEGERIPAVSIRNTVKLPNTRFEPHGLGSNETDYFGELLLSRVFGRTQLRFSAGLGIVGDPRAANAQDDVYSLGFAALVHAREDLILFAETFGVTGYFKNDNKLVLRAGASVALAGVEWDFYASTRISGNHIDAAGAFELSEDWGVGFVLRRKFEIHF